MVDAKLFSKLVQGRDMTISLAAFNLDGKSCVFAPPDRAVQSVEQGGELGGAQIFKSAEVGDNRMAGHNMIFPEICPCLARMYLLH